MPLSHGLTTTICTLHVQLTDDPNGLSGLMTLLINTLIMFSSLSCSGSGAPPNSSSPLPSSKVAVNMGISIYCRIYGVCVCVHVHRYCGHKCMSVCALQWCIVVTKSVYSTLYQHTNSGTGNS